MKKIRNSGDETNSPSRKLGRSQHGKQTTYFHSIKNNCTVVCETRLEADACYLFEFDDNISSYYAQPKPIHVVVNKKHKKYTPDFKLVFASGYIRYIEVKPDNVYEKPNYMALYRAVRDEAKRKGEGFKLITESSIRRQPRHKNMSHIYFQMRHTRPEELSYLMDQMSVMQLPTCIGLLFEISPPPSMGAIAKAIFKKIITFDLNERLSLGSDLNLEKSQ
jgi:hypothetical protein